MDNFELWKKPKNYQYTKKEEDFLVDYLIKKIKVKYGIYNGVIANKGRISFIYDSNSNATRKSGLDNYWEIISIREMSKEEALEYITFYFRKQYKRFLVFYYKNIDKLIMEDKKLDAQTPQEFIEKLKKEKLC